MSLKVGTVVVVGTVHMRFHMAWLLVVVEEVVDCNTAGLRTDSVGRLADIEAAAKVKEVWGSREVQKKGTGSLAAW